MKSYISSIFAGEDGFSAEKNNVDVTERFIQDINDLYETLSKSIEEPLMARSIANRYNREFSNLATVSNIKNTNEKLVISIAVVVQGSATCENNGKILSFANPYMNISSSSRQDLEMINIYSNASNKGSYIRVSAGYTPSYDVYQNGYPYKTFAGTPYTIGFYFTQYFNESEIANE